MSDYDFRFGGLERLYGVGSLSRLREAHVAVIGIGGVGSWAAEALARSGVGSLTLVDLDEVCVSNINRQLPAMEETIGRSKVEVMAERIRSIHPGCQVHSLLEVLTESTVDRILDEFQTRRGLWVVDAIDSSPNKCRLVLGCRRRDLRLVISGAAGGRQDPTSVRVTDLAAVTHDRLLADLRGRLRREPAFDSVGKIWGLPTVHSSETPQRPIAQTGSCDGSFASSTEAGPTPRMNCQSGYGSATFVTGAFGFAAASHVVQQICKNP